MKTARKKNVSAKAWLSRISNQILDLLPNENSTLAEVEDIIVQFEERLKTFDHAQQELELLIDDDEQLENEIETASLFRKEKRATLLKAKELANRLNTKSSPKSDTDESVTNLNSSHTRLPMLELDKFSGEYTHWQTFWDKFCAVVDSSDLPPINKFTYLQSLLRGDAASSIKGLALTASNYETAKDILVKRFGRPERIIFGHIQTLLSHSSKTDCTLWELYDEIQGHVRSLHNLGVSGERYGVFLTPLVLHQLPPPVRLEWARVGEGHEGDLEFLLNFLYDEIQRRERSSTFHNSESFRDDVPRTINDNRATSNRKKRVIGSASALSVTDRQCVLCKKGNHYPDKCDTLKNLNFEQRKGILSKLGLCFRCLSSNHLASKCSTTCYFCHGTHHSVLCKKKIPKSNETGATVKCQSDQVHVGVSYSHSASKTTLMQVVNTTIGDKAITVMFDSGSDRSFITKECAHNLKLKQIGKEDLAYACFGEEEVKEGVRNVFELNAGGERIKLIAMNKICSTMFRSPVPIEILNNFSGILFNANYLNGESVNVDILIGLDWYWPLIKSQSNVTSEGLVAQETIFGWMLSGVYYDPDRTKLRNEGFYNKSQIMFCNTQLSQSTVEKMWHLESIGITTEDCDNDKVNEKFLEEFTREKITFDNGDKRYVVQVPWKNGLRKSCLLDNRDIAERRLSNLNKKLEKDPLLKDRYDTVFHEYEKEGIIEEVSSNELENHENNDPIFYLPHRPVVRESSQTTKVRPVFDASCKGVNGISLNDCLDAGPKLVPDLVQVLIRFRKWKFGLTGDIQKAFLQIKLHASDQNAHRFLWLLDGQVRIMKFLRVCFGNTSSPFLLNATIKHHLTKFEMTSTLDELNNNLYVDDWITGADTENEVLEMMTEAGNIMRQGGFVLTKWTSSSKNNQSEIKAFDGFKELETMKVLGLTWDTDEDCFRFQLHVITTRNDCLFSKRMLLSLTARLFDPLGLLTPFIITLKILFQDAWKEGYDWDDILPEEMQHTLRKWMSDLHLIHNWKIPRSICVETWVGSKHKELLVFVDASERAYGCCIYMKTTEENTTKVSLVMSRVKVAPLKKITLPRLELLAALLGARLLKYVSTALNLEKDLKYRCWTDSQIVLGWIRSEPSRWKQFVRNRVIEIQELTDPSKWQHCSGKTNPSDLLTRGETAGHFISSTNWLNGPKWLTEQRQMENKTIIENKFESEVHEELISGEPDTLTCALEVENRPLIDFERYSTFAKLLRVMGLVLKFIKKLKKIADINESDNLCDAKLVILKLVQHQYYQKEMNELKRVGTLKRGSVLWNLSPFVDKDGLLKVGGRLEQSHELSYDEKHPTILPKCHVSFLLVKSQHLILKHAGINLLMTSLRNKYWIISLRPIAKRVVKFCVACQRQDRRVMDQCTGLLPENRITKTYPFSTVGLDNAGPLFCSDLPEKKLYILLFTCAVTRAVHLELVDSLSAEEFCMAFKKFAARRAVPSIIYCDNAKTFKKAQSLLNAQLGHETITWKKQPALAPWWGGFYERMVRSVKSGLRKSIGKNLVTRKELEVALIEVEACVNSRPLTGISDNDNYLTPSHFLIGRGCPLTPPVVSVLNSILDLESIEKHQSKLFDKFWEIWRLEYLRSLSPVRTSKHINDGLKEGSLVLIQDANHKRMLWDMGKVLKFFKGADGHVRAAEIKTKTNILVRPIQRLVLLELDGPNQEIEEMLEDTHPVNVNRDTDNALHAIDTENDETTADVVKTRYGRTVKPHKVLDL